MAFVWLSPMRTNGAPFPLWRNFAKCECEMPVYSAASRAVRYCFSICIEPLSLRIMNTDLTSIVRIFVQISVRAYNNTYSSTFALVDNRNTKQKKEKHPWLFQQVYYIVRVQSTSPFDCVAPAVLNIFRRGFLYTSYPQIPLTESLTTSGEIFA